MKQSSSNLFNFKLFRKHLKYVIEEFIDFQKIMILR